MPRLETNFQSPSSSLHLYDKDHEIRKDTDTLVYALGGLGEVGKNMYCIEHAEEIIIIDAGVKFPEENILGVDYVIPEYTYLIRNQHKIKGLLITHGHEDHIGGIPFLLRAIPNIDFKIYGTRFALCLIEKKLEEHRVSRNCELIEINQESRVDTKYFHIGFFNTVHSIPDTLGILVNTPNGRIVSTGDFKFDLTPVGNNSDYQVMAYMGQIGVTLLLSDSTNSAIKDFSVSEKKVAQTVLNTMKRTTGRLIISTFASNVHRVQQILESAELCGRKVCIFGRSMENVVEIGRKLGHIHVPESLFVDPTEINNLPPEKVCLLCTGSQGEPLAALSRIANGTHRYISIIPGDTVVFSSNPIPGNAYSVNKVVDRLVRIGANVITNSVLNSLHTTGHASQQEQLLMLQLIKPKYFMPMHGEYKMLKMHAKTGMETGIPEENIFICSNGDVVVLRDGQAIQTNARVQTDAIYVDGNDASGVATAVLKDRKILADNGMVAVLVTIDSRYNKILCRPSIVSRGFVYLKENQQLLKDGELLVYEALRKKMMMKTTFGELKNTIRNTLEPYFYQQTHRSPIIIPVVLNHRAALNYKRPIANQ
ncbi:MAG: ribonuclease J [Erysipelotrichaceae bacterium]|nr:ribonuclease J [Erysipelotrichaceae bacterium]